MRGDPPLAASHAVLAEVSGYASHVRGEKPLVFAQAYFDDSASDVGDQRLFIAGYLNTAEKWALFADAWDEELRTRPQIEYLKMVEANSRRGQFWGWSECARDDKLRGLARVVRHFKPLSFQFSVSRRQYFDIVSPNAPRFMQNAHFSCSFGIVSLVARFLASNGAKSPIDFIFDRQDGVSVDVQLFFEYLIKELPRNARKLISGTPTFKDDRQLMPLQAADMLAWHIRREHETGNNIPLADLLRSSHHVMSELDDRCLNRWSKEFKSIPGIKRVKTKGQWQSARRGLIELAEAGYIPPYGNRIKNLIYWFHKRITWLFSSGRKR